MTLRPLCTQCFKPQCRRARPLCRRKDNPRNVTCACSGYHFPHRYKAGNCIHNPEANARMWREVDRPIRRAR